MAHVEKSQLEKRVMIPSSHSSLRVTPYPSPHIPLSQAHTSITRRPQKSPSHKSTRLTPDVFTHNVARFWWFERFTHTFKPRMIIKLPPLVTLDQAMPIRYGCKNSRSIFVSYSTLRRVQCVQGAVVCFLQYSAFGHVDNVDKNQCDGRTFLLCVNPHARF